MYYLTSFIFLVINNLSYKRMYESVNVKMLESGKKKAKATIKKKQIIQKEKKIKKERRGRKY